MKILKAKSTIQNVEQIKKIESDKHFKRVQDIIKKANGDNEKAIQLTKTMANRIESADKAYGRYLVAKQLGYNDIADIFLNKYNYMTQSRRERISNLGL